MDAGIGRRQLCRNDGRQTRDRLGNLRRRRRNGRCRDLRLGDRLAGSSRSQRAGKRQRGCVAARRILVHCAREHRVQAVALRGDRQCSHLRPRPCRAPRRQQLERDRRQREDVGRRAPCRAGDALGRTVRPPHGRANTHLVQRFDHAKSRGARFIRRDEDIARVQTAVPDPGGTREVDRAGKLRDERQHLFNGRRMGGRERPGWRGRAHPPAPAPVPE